MAKSDFEKGAQQAAVEAVERRWRQKNDAERRRRRRKRVKNIMAGMILFAGLLGVGWFSVNYYEVDIPLLVPVDVRGVMSMVASGAGPSKAEVDRRSTYARLLSSFKGKEFALWRDAPASIKPRSATVGTRYLALCGTRDDKRLYELVADGKGSMSVLSLSPISEPIEQGMRDFRNEVGDRPYLVLCGDIVYAVGCATDSIARELAGKLLE